VKNSGFIRSEDIDESLSKPKDLSALESSKETVVRDRQTGKRLTREDLARREQELSKQKKRGVAWSAGVSQIREHAARIQELTDAKSKPFARSADDLDMNTDLQRQVHWQDPMLKKQVR
jgi:hypothetical protein